MEYYSTKKREVLMPAIICTDTEVITLQKMPDKKRLLYDISEEKNP